mmetsp:Transcript_8174/g.12546  ORF Transcript_8174/g.12546 Transcript_8174/m.12546 type:complete len:106 (+) Transcript_8174:207-524(+)
MNNLPKDQVRRRTESEETFLSSSSSNTGTMDSIASIDTTVTSTQLNSTTTTNAETGDIPSVFLPKLINSKDSSTNDNIPMSCTDKSKDKSKRKKTHRRSEFCFIG